MTSAMNISGIEYISEFANYHPASTESLLTPPRRSRKRDSAEIVSFL